MKYRRLGASELVVSKMIAGGVIRGDERSFIRALRLQFDHGVNAVDTAPSYGDGASELAVGRAIAGSRHRVLVMSKVGVTSDLSRASIHREVDKSLERLGLDQIDLLQIHRPDPKTPLDETIAAMVELLREGKIRAIGVCNFTPPMVADAKKYLGSVPLASVQAPYSLLDRRCPHRGTPVLAYAVLGRGALAEKNELPTDDRRWAKEFAFENRLKIARLIERTVVPIAKRHRATAGQIAIAWALAGEEIAAVIAGASDERQAVENVDAVELRLTRDEINDLRDAFERADIDENGARSIVSRAERFLRRVVNS